MTATRFIAIVALAAWAILPGQSAQRRSESAYSFRSPRSVQIGNTTHQEGAPQTVARMHRALRGKNAVSVSIQAGPAKQFTQPPRGGDFGTVLDRTRGTAVWRHHGHQRDRAPPVPVAS